MPSSGLNRVHIHLGNQYTGNKNKYMGSEEEAGSCPEPRWIEWTMKPTHRTREICPELREENTDPPVDGHLAW